MLNRFHPIYHAYTYLAGSRIDIERVLEPALDFDDREDFVDEFSTPPEFFERLSPVTTQVADREVKGRNWTDMMIQCYRVFGKIFARVTNFLRQSLVNNHGETTMLPFMSITVDPDTLVRLIEYDYEAGENSYGKLIELFETGVVAPAVTTPFHSVLPLLPTEFDQRLTIRLGFMFYAPILRAYSRYLEKIGENEMAIGFWAPEAVVTQATLRIAHEEFMDLCQREKFPEPHLVMLLDADMAPDIPLDRLMKSWCQVKVGRTSKDVVSVVFRDPAFSGWMMNSHPSIKKIIDRTIAKIDRGLTEQEVDYGWAHFESLEALTYSSKDAVNYEQRILKLCELGYLSISPETYARRKRNGRFGVHKDEPMEVKLADFGPDKDPAGKDSRYGGWRGFGLDKTGKPRVMPNTAYVRKQPKGNEKRPGSPAWKVAWTLTRDQCFRRLAGDPKTFRTGLFGVLASLAGTRKKEAIHRNVEAFLEEYGLVYWREHFIQHDLSEADVRLDEIIERSLRKGARKKLSLEEMAAAASAAQAYYFLLDSCNSYALHAVNMDQRALFQNAVMLTLAFCNVIAANHYLGKKDEADALVEVLQTELFDFRSALQRYELAEYGITKTAWQKALQSEIPESSLNVVERASRRTAARHLGAFGYESLFEEEDEEMTTNVGHNWNSEVDIPNYKWANPYFCGVREA